MHSGEPDPIFHAPRRPRKGPRKLTRKCHERAWRHANRVAADAFVAHRLQRLWRTKPCREQITRSPTSGCLSW